MGDVIYMSDFRPEQKPEDRSSELLTDVCITQFNPHWSDNKIILSLVYNQPSILDSYYVMYPDEAFVIRYEDAVYIHRTKTGKELTVVRLGNDDLWYANEAENINV